MSERDIRSTDSRGPLRTAATGAALVLALTGIAACSDDDSAGPEAGAVTLDDFQSLEERVGGLEEDVGVLQDEVGGLGAGAGVDDGPGAGEASDIIGQEVTVSAEVSELITTTDVGSAFRIGAEGGPSVAVLATSPPEGLDANDVVQITGTVRMVQRTSFEEDFGIAEDELFDDPDFFFDDFEGELGIAATSIEVLQEQAEE